MLTAQFLKNIKIKKPLNLDLSIKPLSDNLVMALIGDDIDDVSISNLLSIGNMFGNFNWVIERFPIIQTRFNINLTEQELFLKDVYSRMLKIISNLYYPNDEESNYQLLDRLLVITPYTFEDYGGGLYLHKFNPEETIEV